MDVDLYRLCQNNRLEDVRTVLKCGIDVNVRGKHGSTALHVACENASLELVKLLLDHGGNVDEKNINGQTPLDLFLSNLGDNVKRNFVDCDAVMCLLLRRVAKDDLHQNAGGLLLSAATNGLKDTVLFLINNEKCNISDEFFSKALCTTDGTFRKDRSDNYVQVIEILLRNGADVNALYGSYQTPLFTACLKGYVPIVKVLLDNGANVNGAGSAVPICIASRQGRNGMMLNRRVGSDGFHYMYGDLMYDYAEVVKLLVSKGADPNVVDRFQCTPLYNACYKGNLQMATTLLEHGANVNGTDRAVPLIRVCTQGRTEILNLLIKHGADVNIKDHQGRTALLIVMQEDNSLKADNLNEIVTILLQNGAHVNVIDRNGKTPLYYACSKRFSTIVADLIAHGADTVGTADVNPLTAACKWGDIQIVKQLLDAGADAFLLDVDYLFDKLVFYRYQSVSLETGVAILRLLVRYSLNFDLTPQVKRLFKQRHYIGYSLEPSVAATEVLSLSEMCCVAVRTALRTSCRTTSQFLAAIDSLQLPKVLEDIACLRRLP